MTKARKYICNENLNAFYHCINRVVQRAFLFGVDPHTKTNYDYRLDWVHQRLKEISTIFTIQVGGYSFMHNHLHLLLQTRPDLTDELTPSEVAKRWLKLYPPKKSKKQILTPEQWTLYEKEIISNKILLAKYRERLGSLSWFMKSLSEPIARRANQESKCTGRFWQGRFNAKLLTSAEAVILCQAYIDLNPIRAGIADKPETSRHTGIYERINANEAVKKLMKINEIENTGKKIHKDKHPKIEKTKNLIGSSDWLAPFYQGDSHLRPFYKLTENEYLNLLDNTAREISPNKKGYMDASLDSIFERLKIDRDQWLDAILNYDKWFFRIVGKISIAMEMVKDTTTRWFKGSKINEHIFGK